jgi:ankyrin repeat protein
MKKNIIFILGAIFLFIFSTIVFAEENVIVSTENTIEQTAEKVGDKIESNFQTQEPIIQKTEESAIKQEELKPIITEVAKPVLQQNSVEPQQIKTFANKNTSKMISKEETKSAIETQMPVETVKNSSKTESIKPKTIPELEVTTTEADTLNLYPAFFIMAKRGDNSILKMFIDKKLEVNRKNENGMTVLLEAVKSNQIDTVKFLISNGADVKVVTNNGINALRFAVDNNNSKLIKLFLKKDVNVAEKDVLGQTPLMISIEKNYYKITKMLLDHLKAFDVDVQDRNGKSLLMSAVENNDVSLVKTLIKKNVNIWLINNKNEDALTLAQRHNNKKLITLLEKQMKDDKQKNPKVEHWLRKPGDKTNSGAK